MFPDGYQELNLIILNGFQMRFQALISGWVKQKEKDCLHYVQAAVVTVFLLYAIPSNVPGEGELAYSIRSLPVFSTASPLTTWYR